MCVFWIQNERNITNILFSFRFPSSDRRNFGRIESETFWPTTSKGKVARLERFGSLKRRLTTSRYIRRISEV